MNKKSTIIKFPDNRLKSTAPAHDPDDVGDDFEEWETDYELREKEDWPGLVEYCKQRAERLPDDPYAQYYLGEAYVLNGEYDKAIEFLSEHHRRQPWNPDYHGVILDALYALGKSEDDFDWVQKPVVLRLSREVLDACYEFLRSRRKPRSVNEIRLRFVMEGYVLFTEEDLLKALLEDGRFVVEDADAVLFAQVRAIPKRRTKRK
jgi:tetratricopeptide (TPR) repeat protein